MTFIEAIAAAREGARSSGQAYLVQELDDRWSAIEWDGGKHLRGRILILPDRTEFAVLDGEPWSPIPAQLARLRVYRKEG